MLCFTARIEIHCIVFSSPSISRSYPWGSNFLIKAREFSLRPRAFTKLRRHDCIENFEDYPEKCMKWSSVFKELHNYSLLPTNRLNTPLQLLSWSSQNFGLRQKQAPRKMFPVSVLRCMHNELLSRGLQSIAVYNGFRDIWHPPWFSCGIAHSGRGLVSVSQEFSASINKASILTGGLGISLSFYGVWTLSFPNFLRFPKS